MTTFFTDCLQNVLIPPAILPYVNRQCVREALNGRSTFNNKLQNQKESEHLKHRAVSKYYTHKRCYVGDSCVKVLFYTQYSTRVLTPSN